MVFTGTPLGGKFDRVRVPKLMRREPPSDAAFGGELAELAAGGRARPATRTDFVTHPVHPVKRRQRSSTARRSGNPKRWGNMPAGEFETG